MIKILRLRFNFRQADIYKPTAILIYSKASMLLSCSYILLCSCVAYAQVLKFSLQRDVGSVVPQNGTQIVELAYRYDNQFGWNNIASYPVKSCPCGPLVSGPGCGEIQLNIATTGIDVTRPVQFRWIQSGQGRYEWSLDAVSFRGLTYDDFQTMQALPRYITILECCMPVFVLRQRMQTYHYRALELVE